MVAMMGGQMLTYPASTRESRVWVNGYIQQQATDTRLQDGAGEAGKTKKMTSLVYWYLQRKWKKSFGLIEKMF